MKRVDIFSAISDEIESAIYKWPRDERRQVMYSFPPAHLLLLEEKILQTRTVWYTSDRPAVMRELVKIAALAVRALEEIKTEL